MYLRKEIFSTSSDNIEKKIRNYSIKRNTLFDTMNTSDWMEDESKKFFGKENKTYLKITRKRNILTRYLPKIIIRFDKSDFNNYKMRFDAFTLIGIIFFILIIVNGLIDLVNGKQSDLLLNGLIIGLLLLTLIGFEFKLLKKTIKKIFEE